MTKVLITAYDIDPYKGSEAGMGWNFIKQISKNIDIIAITRKNNQNNIERYILENNLSLSIKFEYFDLPKWSYFWKRGQRGSSIYFYLWQAALPFWVRQKNFEYDVLHNLNFHTDAFPSFLWVLKKPWVWGPINHHEKIDIRFILKEYGILSYLKDRLKWMVKLFNWNIDPFMNICKQKADVIFCGNKSVESRLNLKSDKCKLLSSVGIEKSLITRGRKSLEQKSFSDGLSKTKKFSVISVGRFVPLKGFDISIKGFEVFTRLSPDIECELVLVGTGPERKRLDLLIDKLELRDRVKIIDWLDRADLMDLYSNSDVFLFPSHEGAGMVVMEAMAFGLPVICFDNYGPGELIDKNCGKIIAYDNYDQTVENFGKALKELSESPELMMNMACCCIERAEKHFCWDIKSDPIIQAYEQILNNP